MKKIFLIISAAVTITNMAIAQERVILTDSRDAFKFGLKVGANLANVYDTKGQDFQADAKFGLAAGAFVSIPIGTIIGIQPEVLFSQKGFKATGSVIGNRYEFTRTSNYIDVPLFVTFKPSEFVSLMAGPQYSFLTKQKDVFTNSFITTEQESNFNNDNIRKNTLCFVMGLDVNLQHVVLSARAGWDIQNNNGDGSSTEPRYKNVWYQATLGFRF